MRALLTFFFLLSFSPAGAQTKPSFDCGTARHPTEILICEITNLAEQDRKLAQLYASVLAASTESQKLELRAQQRTWVKSRNSCGADFGCVSTAYWQRLLDLGRVTPAWTQYKASFECKDKSSLTEKAICGSEALAATDIDLAQTYKSALAKLPEPLQSDVRNAQRLWIKKRNECGSGYECLSSRMNERIEALNNLLAPTAPVQSAIKAQITCENDSTSLINLEASVEVVADTAKSAKVGEMIWINWQRNTLSAPDGSSVHLVFTMPEWVRFSGNYLIPLPPGAPAPSKLEHARDKMRVVLPLTSSSAPKASKFAVKAYRSELLNIEYAVVSKSSCGERVLSAGKISSIEIEPGLPNVVFQDFYSLDKPEKTIISNNGKYRLEIFNASYRVFDVASGTKIVDRPGLKPNFSPEARFVAAHAGENELQLFDLIARQPLSNFDVHGPTLGWGFNDGLLFGGANGSDLRVYRTLVDPDRKIEANPTGPAFSDERGFIEALTGKGYPWETYDIAAFPDQGIIVIQGGTYQLLIADLASLQILHPSKAQLESGDSTNMSTIRDVLERYGVSDFAGLEGWRADGPIRLSHYDEDVEFGITGGESRFEGSELQRSYLVTHTGMLPTTLSKSVKASPSPVAIFSDNMSRSASASALGPKNSALNRFADRLKDFGVCIESACHSKIAQDSVEAIILSSEFERVPDFINWKLVSQFKNPTADVKAALLREVPIAQSHLATPDEDTCMNEWSDDQTSRRNRMVKFQVVSEGEYAGLYGLWRWVVGNKTYWLAQQVCGWRGAIIASSVVLFASAKGSPGHAINFSAADRVYNDADGLHKNFTGIRNDKLLRVRPYVFDNRWLLIAAPAGHSAAIVDLEAPDNPIFVYGLKDIADVQSIARTYDGRRLVQLNSDGRFHIYEVASGNVVISGRYIDEEIIFFTPEGYFWSSHEGSHFVHLMFPGREGLYSLRQFASTLDRPDIIQSVLTGVSRSTMPQLSTPPSLQIEIGVSASNAGREAMLRYRASSTVGLQKLIIYLDGSVENEVQLSSRSESSSITFQLPPEARWISAVAVDINGYESVAQDAALLQPSAPTESRLHIIAFGTDEYRDREFENLTGAKLDAGNFVAMLEIQAGALYGKIETPELLDEQHLKEDLPRRIREVVANARANDTIMMFAAGHGIQAADGKFYLITHATKKSSPETTALAWDEIAQAFDGVKARVIIFLDACRSGATGQSATNDQATSLLTQRSNAITVIAASKGRQNSQEEVNLGGGLFTNAILQAVINDRAKTDSNGNGVIELSELYGSVKGQVSVKTDGEQTPWIARNRMVGQVPLF